MFTMVTLLEICCFLNILFFIIIQIVLSKYCGWVLLDIKHIGNKIRKARKETFKSQAKISKLAKINRSHYSQS